MNRGPPLESKLIRNDLGQNLVQVFNAIIQASGANGFADVFLRTQMTIAPNFFSKLTKLKTKFGISCSKEWVNKILNSIYHPVLCISYLVFALVFLENLTFGLRFG